MTAITALEWRRGVTEEPRDQIADIFDGYYAEVGPDADDSWMWAVIVHDGYSNRDLAEGREATEEAAKDAVEKYRLATLYLILTDGTVHEGHVQWTNDGLDVKVDTATCGHCGFTWNDALGTGITPVPSGRCPNEYNHVYDDDEDSDEDKPFRVEIHGEYGVNDGSIHLFNGPDEVVMWDSAEWVEDPSLVYVIANAIHTGYDQGHLTVNQD